MESSYSEFESGYLEHSRWLWAGGILAVTAGLLLPLPSRILDVLLIFSVSLTVAVLIVTFSARSALQVLGFPMLVLLAVGLRLVSSAASAKLISSQTDAGVVIDFFGGLFVRDSYVSAIAFFGLAVLVSFAVICKSLNDIGRTSRKFITDIVSHKQIGADNLLGQFSCEIGFFVGMTKVAKFMLYAAVIDLLIIIANIMVSMAKGVAGPGSAGISAGLALSQQLRNDSLRNYATLAIGAGMAAQIPGLLAAMACQYLVRKSALRIGNEANTAQESARRVKVVANEVKVSQVEQDRLAKTIDHIWYEEELEPCENKSDERKSAGKKYSFDLWVWEEIKKGNGYNVVTEFIKDKSDSLGKVLLMAAENVEELPVTMPVNVGIGLAQNNKKCLLIDLDLQRNAISKVFDVRCDNAESKAVATCISNLWVLPAINFDKGRANSIKTLFADMEEQYDHLIVYAPDTGTLKERVEIAERVRLAMLFGPDAKIVSSSMIWFQKFLAGSGCKILNPEEILSAG